MPRCPDCNSSSDIFGLYGDGVCSHCHGDGKSLMSGLNEAIMGTVLKCNYCDGSGVCQTCGGSGTVGGNDDKEEYSSVHRTEPEQPSSQSSSSFESTYSDHDSCDDDTDSDTSDYSGSYSASYSSSNIQSNSAYSAPKSTAINNRLLGSNNSMHQYHRADHRSAIFKRDHRKDHRG
jgi:hypothetical protein